MAAAARNRNVTDILGVVATAATQGLADPASMRLLVVMPLGLLPTFLVPLIIASHVLLSAAAGVRNSGATRRPISRYWSGDTPARGGNWTSAVPTDYGELGQPGRDSR